MHCEESFLVGVQRFRLTTCGSINLPYRIEYRQTHESVKQKQS